MEFDGIRFLGATLWTNIPSTFGVNAQLMNDYSKIRIGLKFRKISREETTALHMETVGWLTEMLAESFDGKTVVITHHAPSFKSWKVRDSNDDIFKHFYCSDLEHLIAKPIDLWIHGHLHQSMDYLVNGTQVVCNPAGYSGVKLNSEFDEKMVVTL